MARCINRRTCITAVALALAASAPDVPAETASIFFDQAFATAQGGTPCYGRTYDEAHLKSHTQQTVRAIEIDMAQSNASEIANTPERFELGFAVMTRKSAEWYGGVAICKAAGDQAECFLEGDGGKFKLTSAADGAVRLETGGYGLAFEGTKDFIELSGKDGDDRVFLLNPGRAECDAAEAFFNDSKSLEPG